MVSFMLVSPPCGDLYCNNVSPPSWLLCTLGEGVGCGGSIDARVATWGSTCVCVWVWVWVCQGIDSIRLKLRGSIELKSYHYCKP